MKGDIESSIIEISVELSDICLTIFEQKYEDIKHLQRAPRKQEFDLMNQTGLQSINYSQKALSLIVQREEKFDYAISIINISLSVARVYSKLYDRELSV